MLWRAIQPCTLEVDFEEIKMKTMMCTTAMLLIWSVIGMAQETEPKNDAVTFGSKRILRGETMTSFQDAWDRADTTIESAEEGRQSFRARSDSILAATRTVLAVKNKKVTKYLVNYLGASGNESVTPKNGSGATKERLFGEYNPTRSSFVVSQAGSRFVVTTLDGKGVQTGYQEVVKNLENADSGFPEWRSPFGVFIEKRMVRIGETLKVPISSMPSSLSPYEAGEGGKKQAYTATMTKIEEVNGDRCALFDLKAKYTGRARPKGTPNLSVKISFELVGEIAVSIRSSRVCSFSGTLNFDAQMKVRQEGIDSDVTSKGKVNFFRSQSFHQARIKKRK